MSGDRKRALARTISSIHSSARTAGRPCRWSLDTGASGGRDRDWKVAARNPGVAGFNLGDLQTRGSDVCRHVDVVGGDSLSS